MENPIESNVYATFYTDAILMGYKSEVAGKPVYEDVPFIKIIIPGDKNNIIDRKAKDADKIKYKAAWDAYQKAEGGNGLNGTPIEQWTQISKSQIKEAKYYEVHTIEHMAGLTDAHVQKLGMGFGDLRRKAKAYLGLVEVDLQAQENAKLRDMMASLQSQIESLKSVGASDEAPIEQKKKPGRPAKGEMAEDNQVT